MFIIAFALLKVIYFIYGFFRFYPRTHRRIMPRIEVDANRCKACYLCVSACPKKCLGKAKTISKKGYFPAVMERPQDCIGCKMCYMMCPDIAITVIKE